MIVSPCCPLEDVAMTFEINRSSPSEIISHWVQQDAPQLVNELLQEFLA